MGSGGTVGPLAIRCNGEPIMSERIKDITRARVRAKSWPPFRADKRVRTVLISSIEAPALERARIRSCFSVSVTGDFGSGASADPPPVISTKRISVSVKDSIIWTIFWEANKLDSSGMLSFAPSITYINTKNMQLQPVNSGCFEMATKLEHLTN